MLELQNNYKKNAMSKRNTFKYSTPTNIQRILIRKYFSSLKVVQVRVLSLDVEHNFVTLYVTKWLGYDLLLGDPTVRNLMFT